MIDAAYHERLARLRADATERVEPVCRNCGAALREIRAQRVGPPTSATMTSWEHVDGRGIWCDGHSHLFAAPVTHAGNAEVLWLLDQLTARDEQVAKMTAAITETQRLAREWSQHGGLGVAIVVRPLSGTGRP